MYAKFLENRCTGPRVVGHRTGRVRIAEGAASVGVAATTTANSGVRSGVGDAAIIGILVVGVGRAVASVAEIHIGRDVELRYRRKSRQKREKGTCTQPASLDDERLRVHVKLAHLAVVGALRARGRHAKHIYRPFEHVHAPVHVMAAILEEHDVGPLKAPRERVRQNVQLS